MLNRMYLSVVCEALCFGWPRVNLRASPLLVFTDAGDSSGLMIIISVSLASVFFVMVAALLLVYQLRRNRCSALQMCGKGCKHPDSSFCGRRTSFVLGAGGGGNSPGGFFEGAASKSSVQMAKYAPEPHQPAVIAVTDIGAC